jgi:tRNA(Ile)-lysidine synthase
MNYGDLLLTGHHQDDQAETTFMQLIRGSGWKGLAAMPDFKQFGTKYHGRPLLQCSKMALQHYASLHRLHWINDGSNINTRWTRNFIRHEFLPILKQRWPSVTKTIARSANYSAEAQSVLEEFALEAINNIRGVKQLIRLSPAKQRLILRTWIHSLGYSLPNSNKIIAIQKNVLTAAADRMPSVCWKQVVVRRYRDDLYITTLFPKHDHTEMKRWQLTSPLILPGIGQLIAVKTDGEGLHADIQEVFIGFRQGGEALEVPGRGRHILKHLLQEWGVPPWLRDRIPLIFVDGKLIGLIWLTPIIFIADQYTAKENEIGYELSLQKATLT